MTEEEATEQYMHGYCMFMAAALHHEYGWPIGLFTIKHGDQLRLSHAWVITPAGHLDIQGIQTIEQVTVWMNDAPECVYELHTPSTLAMLEQLSGTSLPADEVDVVAALAVAKLYLRGAIDDAQAATRSLQEEGPRSGRLLQRRRTVRQQA